MRSEKSQPATRNPHHLNPTRPPIVLLTQFPNLRIVEPHQVATSCHAPTSASLPTSNVDVLHVQGVVLDKFATEFDVVAHEYRERFFRVDDIAERDLE